MALTDADLKQASLWWRTHSPQRYTAILDALPIGGIDRPDTPEAWEALLLEYPEYLTDTQPAVDQEQMLLWIAAGLLFFWVLGAHQFISQGGQLQGPTMVRGAWDQAAFQATRSLQALAEGLRDGTISLEQWQDELRRHYYASHITAAAMAKGGWLLLTYADLLLLTDILTRHDNFLAGFVQDILSGRQRLDGTLLRRMQLYVQAGRSTYHDFERDLMLDSGFTEERNILTPVEHCQGAGSCPEETDRGWVPIGTLTPIGWRRCGANCRCYLEYR